MSKQARYIQHCRIPKYLPGHQQIRGGASTQKVANMEGLHPRQIEQLAVLGHVYGELPAPEASIKDYLRDPVVEKLLARIVDLSDDVEFLDNRLDKAYSTAVRYTVDAEGCESGKREFLDEMGVPEEMLPTQTFRVTFTTTYDVICLARDTVPESDVEEAISDDDTPLSEMDYSIKKDDY